MAADSTAMTIDFLRARLLSERSVSRAARERADQLAKRVMELEEQLKTVTTQRKKAEKATSEVLSILESQGFGYDTEPELIDSSSDQEDEEIMNNPITTTTKEEGKHEEEEDSSIISPQVGSLSWKGRSKSPDSHKKHKAKQLRQRQRRIFYFTSPDPSPKYQLGKSCRKIKPKLKGEEEGENSKCVAESSNENTSMGFYLETSRNEPELEPEPESGSGCVDDNEEREEMDRVLEEQENFIDQFQAEEKAQRDWEKIYHESRNPSLIADECEDKDENVGSKSSRNGSVTDDEHISYEKAIVLVSDISMDTNKNRNNDETESREISSVPSSPSSESYNPLALQLYEPPPNKVENVLEALRRAKISLRQNLRLPNTEILAITEHGEPDINVPIGTSSSLFRLPTRSYDDDDFNSGVLSLEYSKDLMKRFSSNYGGHEFYEDFTNVPVRNRLFLYGGDLDPL